MVVGTPVLGILGLVLLFGGPLLARAVSRWHPGAADPVGAALALQLVGVALLVLALLVRPADPEIAAFPPHPDSPERAEARPVPGGSAKDAALRALDRPE
jgi:hypothetical protein